MNLSGTRANIMVVDDAPGNIKIIKDILHGKYRLFVATNGLDALATVAAESIDLVMLDIIMPGIDGYEVCRRLKASEKTQNIPVIFVTAKNQSGDETMGFESGGADYITKPFVPSVVLARVETHVRLKRAQDMLKEQNKNLEETVQQRTKQLIHADRLASLGTFSAGMAHEINNPNAFISANLSFLKQFCEISRPILHRHQQEDSTKRVGMFLDEVEKSLDGILDGSKRISTIIDSLKAYSKGGMASDKKECRLLDPVRDAENLLKHRLKRGTQLVVQVPDDLMLVCDKQQMSQVFVNLFNNAMDAMDDAGTIKNKRITVHAESVNNHISIRVKDNGPGIPPNIIGTIFDPFVTSKGHAKGTGLGLSIVFGIIQDHAGHITVSSSPEAGAETEFVIIVPNSDTFRRNRGGKHTEQKHDRLKSG